jgi:hypothetical protein
MTYEFRDLDDHAVDRCFYNTLIRNEGQKSIICFTVPYIYEEKKKKKNILVSVKRFIFMLVVMLDKVTLVTFSVVYLRPGIR